MKWINRTVLMTMVLALSVVTAWAQPKECDDEFKSATYSKWYDNVKTNQEVAYQAAVEYLTVCPNEPADNAYATALRNFKKKYEDALGNNKLAADFEAAVKAKNYPDQVRLGKQLVALPSHADNAVIYILMAGAGLADAKLLAESAHAAKKAIELVQTGKPVTPAYQTKDQALAAMNYVIAKSMMENSPSESITYFVKALRFESDLKRSPIVYNELATAYGEGPLDKYAKEYKVLADAGKPVDSPEVKLVIANLNQAFDGQIDAFARAAAVSTSAADKKAIMDVLAAVYKDRNKKDPAENELNNLVASVVAKPIPDAPTPITSLPTNGPSQTGTGTSGAGSTASTGAPPSGSMPNSGSAMNPSNAGGRTTTPATSTPTTTAPAKPTPKPKSRRANHRRGR